jgi:hypothetical protein
MVLLPWYRMILLEHNYIKVKLVNEVYVPPRHIVHICNLVLHLIRTVGLLDFLVCDNLSFSYTFPNLSTFPFSFHYCETFNFPSCQNIHFLCQFTLVILLVWKFSNYVLIGIILFTFLCYLRLSQDSNPHFMVFWGCFLYGISLKFYMFTMGS